MPLKLASKWLRCEGGKDEVLKDAKHLNPMHKHPVYCEGAEEVPFAGASVGSGAAGCGCGAGEGPVPEGLMADGSGKVLASSQTMGVPPIP